MKRTQNLLISHLTDTGAKRDHNEDSYLFDEELGVYIVCDGMGGHAAGEVASKMATERALHFFREKAELIEKCRSDFNQQSREQIYQILDEGISVANTAIFDRAKKEPEKSGMGTTLVMALLFPNGVFIAHVGDSRAYLFRKGKLKQLTTDHSLVNELLQAGMISKEKAKNHPQGNIITKALGIQSAVVADRRFFETMEGDAFLLCSDGLHDYFHEEGQNQPALSLYQKTPTEELAKEFVQFANQNGGKDNITCLILQIGDKEAPPVHPEQVTVDAKIKTLKKIPLFSSLNYKEISQVLEIVNIVDLEPQKTVLREGDIGDDMFVVLRGELGVFYRDKEVNLLKPGQFFGEMALIDKAKRSATIKTKNQTKLMRIEREEFFPLLKKEPKIGLKVFWAFLQNMNKRLRANDKFIAGLHKDVFGREEEKPSP